MKKYLILTLVLVLLLPLVGFTVLANSEKLTESEIDNYLSNAGFPKEALEILEYEQKVEFYRNEARFAGFEQDKGILRENDDLIFSPLYLENYNFTQSITYAQTVGDKPGTVKYMFTYNWDWNYAPSHTLVDKFGMAFNGSWNPIPNQSRTSYTMYGRWGTSTDTTTSTVTRNGYEAYDISQNGIGWDVDLKNTFTKNSKLYTVYRHKGWGTTYITRAHNGSGSWVSSTALGKFFHKQLGLQGTLTFSKTGPSVSITNITSYDTSKDLGRQWYWKQEDYNSGH